MSIFSNILNKIFSSGHAATPAPSTTATTAPATAPATAPSPAAAAAPAAEPAKVAPSGTEQLDVERVLNGLAEKNPQKLNWRTSIVDLLKLLDLDSSLAARKALATELHFTGDQNDSATMNTWLHQEVLKKLAANGGKVPADLKS